MSVCVYVQSFALKACWSYIVNLAIEVIHFIISNLFTVSMSFTIRLLYDINHQDRLYALIELLINFCNF